MPITGQRTPLYAGAGRSLTAVATAPVLGGRLVVISGPRDEDAGLAASNALRISHAGAGARPIGVAAHDSPAAELLPVYVDGELMLDNTGSAITAGQLVVPAADGRVAPGTGAAVIGIALDDAADGAGVPVRLSL